MNDIGLDRGFTKSKYTPRTQSGGPVLRNSLILVAALSVASSAVGQTGVLTYHYDNARTGQNREEKFLTPSNVTPSQFRQLFFQPVDGQIYGQPLYMSNVSIPGKGTHNVVFVTTEGDSVYAFDADDNKGANATFLWHADLLRDRAYGAAPGATTVPQEPQPEGLWCTDISPQVGITSTSVIDPSAGAIFVVAKSRETVAGTIHYIQRLHALSIANGAEMPGSPVVAGDTVLRGMISCNPADPPYINTTAISVPGAGDGSVNGAIQFNALRQLQRVGLLLQDGVVYIAFGSHCDCAPFHGWVLAYDAKTLAFLHAFNTTPNGSDGGIWMEGSGLAADAKGNVFCAIGNGTFDTTLNQGFPNNKDFGDSIVKLDSHLGVVDYFTPFNQDQMGGAWNGPDQDLGSGGVVLVPDNDGPHPHVLTEVGKPGITYVVDRDQMTTGDQHFCPTCANDLNVIVQEMASAPNGVAATAVPAAWNETVYFRADGDFLKAYPLKNSQLNPPLFQTTDSYTGRITISAKNDRNGIVWSLNTSSSSLPAVLNAYDAVNLLPLYSSSSNASRDNPGNAVPWASPIDANGRIYVGTADRLSVYGLFGIGGYDLESAADKSFAFDYDGSGKADHLAFYRPGTGSIWILKNSAGNFMPVYQQGDPGNGIGGYDLKSPADRAFAFDYGRSGKIDHVVLYRPGTGTIWIVRNSAGRFVPVYQGGGIGGYDLISTADQAFAFDYDGSGKLDHLVLYRPGTGTIWILKNDAGTFTPVYQGSNGIGGYDLKSAADRVLAFDYNGSGKLDHLALYRPGTGTIWILKNDAGTFTPVFQASNGIGGYDLKSGADRVLAFDYDASGKLDHLALYRPGADTLWILKNNAGSFAPVIQGEGIAGYRVASTDDQVIAVDYDASGRFDHLMLFRPGTSKISILQSNAGSFAAVFAAWEHTP